MSLQKVVWAEGMLLTPQHFQQQERYQERYAASLHQFGGGYRWGFAELKIDPHLLRQSKFGLARACGVLPDLSPIDMPHAQHLPMAIDIDSNMRNTVIYLALPLQQAGGAEISNGDNNTISRFSSAEIEIADTSTIEGTEYRIDICNANFRLVTDNADLSGYACLPVARIMEVRDDKSVLLDDNFIPPCVDVHVSERLRGFIAELAGMLHHRAEALAMRTPDGNRPGSADVMDYLMLLTVNRYAPLIAQHSIRSQWHPQDCHALLLQIAGELATFSCSKRRPPPFPDYQHHQLQASFAPLITSLRQSLSMVIEQTAIALPLSLRNYGIRVATISDRSLIGSAQFVLAAKADLPADRIRDRFSGSAKLAPVEQIRQLVNRQLPGMKLSALPVPPRQIPYHSGFVYFEVDRSSDFWAALQTSGGFALHVGEGFPGLELEFWAIRE